MKKYALRGLSHIVIALAVLMAGIVVTAVKKSPAALLPFLPAFLFQLVPFAQARRLSREKWEKAESSRTLPVRAAYILLYSTVAAALACMLFVALRSDGAGNTLLWALLAILLLQTGMLFAVSAIENKKS